MYVCVYVYIYIYIYVCVYMCICVCIYIYMYYGKSCHHTHTHICAVRSDGIPRTTPLALDFVRPERCIANLFCGRSKPTGQVPNPNVGETGPRPWDIRGLTWLDLAKSGGTDPGNELVSGPAAHVRAGVDRAGVGRRGHRGQEALHHVALHLAPQAAVALVGDVAGHLDADEEVPHALLVQPAVEELAPGEGRQGVPLAVEREGRRGERGDVAARGGVPPGLRLRRERDPDDRLHRLGPEAGFVDLGRERELGGLEGSVTGRPGERPKRAPSKSGVETILTILVFFGEVVHKKGMRQLS